MATGTIPPYLPTSKENALYSLYAYLKTQFADISGDSLPAPSIVDLAYEQTITYPNITISDLGMGRLTDMAMGRLIGQQTYGRKEQTLVEFLVQDMNLPDQQPTPYLSAELNVRRMRDQLKFTLENAQMIDQIQANPPNYFLPTIYLLDHNNGDAQTGSYIWHPRYEANAWNEVFLKPTSDQPNLKQYRCTAKIYWLQYESANL